MINIHTDVLKALEYSVSEGQSTEQCPRNWSYSDTDEYCLHCNTEPMCHWLATHQLGAIMPQILQLYQSKHPAASSGVITRSYADHDDRCECAVCRYLSRYHDMDITHDLQPDGYTKQ